MSRMRKKNLRNIKRRVEEKTGLALEAKRCFPVRKLAVLAMAVAACFALVGFTYPLFTPLEGDELSLRGTYEGNGIVSVHVENQSDKTLKFEEQARLMNWLTAEEVPSTGGDILFENTQFPAHSSGIMTIDLSRAYDMEALENPEHNSEWYYLLLTNNGFLFGHDWMCSVDFGKAEPEKEAPAHVGWAADALGSIEEELRFYFEDSYQDEVAGTNEENFRYLQKVDEVIKRFEGKVVSPVYPRILVSGPSAFLDPHPQIRIEESLPASSDWKITDGYGRLVGADTFEKALTVMADVPLALYPDSVSSVPLIYTFVYEADAVQAGEYAFVYGQFLPFEELESCKVYEDESYKIYDVTDYFYTDLDEYIHFLRETRTDLLLDGQACEALREVYEKVRENLGSRIHCQRME